MKRADIDANLAVASRLIADSLKEMNIVTHTQTGGNNNGQERWAVAIVTQPTIHQKTGEVTLTSSVRVTLNGSPFINAPDFPTSVLEAYAWTRKEYEAFMQGTGEIPRPFNEVTE